jgi:hypothetical protein
VLQGAGAISAAVTALAADLTREQHLTKVMAMIGSSIGMVFAVSMVGAPLLYVSIGMPGIFRADRRAGDCWRSLSCSGWCRPPRGATTTGVAELCRSAAHRQLLRLNFGVFALHLMLTAMWVLLPAELVSTGGLPVAEHWKVYLPALLISFVIMVPAIVVAERFSRMKLVFNAAIVLLLVVQAGFGLFAGGLYGLAFWLMLFFVAFNILEATQPSLISRIAPPHAKGAALGVYNTTQALGLFLGGVCGGVLAKYAGSGAVWAGGAVC